MAAHSSAELLTSSCGQGAGKTHQDPAHPSRCNFSTLKYHFMRLWARARSRTAPARPKRRRVRGPQPYERTFSATVRRAQAPKSSHATILAVAGRPSEVPSPIAEVSTCERGDGGAIDNRPVPGRLFCAPAPLARPAGRTSPPMDFKTAPNLIDEHMYRLSRHRHGRVS